MEKVSVAASNDFCPQTLFLYGTYKEDGAPNFGLFCWFSYCWDGEMCVMACIGGEKLTKDRILKTRVFSANLVNRDMLKLADYMGNNSGYDKDKMANAPRVTRGQALNVPILEDSPWSYELEVKRTLDLDDGTILVCAIKNILADKRLTDVSADIPSRLAIANPITTTARTYFARTGETLGKWGDFANAFKPPV